MDLVLYQDQWWIDHEAAQGEEEVEEAEGGVKAEVEKAIELHQSGRAVPIIFRSLTRPKDMEDRFPHQNTLVRRLLACTPTRTSCPLPQPPT